MELRFLKYLFYDPIEKLIKFLSTFHRICISALILFLFSSCGYKVSSVGSNLLSGSDSVISGVISPLIGSIAEDKSQRNLLITSAYATSCADPVYAKLYDLQSDGSIIESAPLASEEVTSNAKYSFNLSDLKLSHSGQQVEYLVKVEGCNGDVYKRPITNVDSKQDLDAATTVVAEVINSNSLLSKTLNQVERKDVDALIKSVTGATTTQALASLTTNTAAMSKFNQIFGASPSVLLSAKPEVIFTYPSSTINELAVANFKVTTSHVNPNYSFVYKWKIDGALKSSGTTLNYIPGALDSGSHQIDLYIGQNDGAGDIDLSKPYFSKTQLISVNNSVLPTPPDFAINAGTPSPVNTNAISLDLTTGVNKVNCASFSHMAITDSAIPPGVMQFTIDCTTAGSQIENVNFSSGDGAKTLYLWAVDNEGTISAAKTVSLVLDTLPPVANLSFSPSAVRGGATQSITLNASDAGSGLSTFDLYFSTDIGSTYSLLSHLSNTDSSYSWSVPAIDTAQGKLKLVATDLTGLATTVYSSIFSIDSVAPTAPIITRSSSAISSSTTVSVGVTCSADYAKILFSQTSTTPSVSDSAWETCASTKNFTITTGDGLKTIFGFTKDAVGNISASSNVTMTLDTTPPAAPVANLASASLSSSTSTTFTITDCLDRPYVLVSESVIAPSASDSAWQTCSTSAAAISYTLVGPVLQGSHTQYIYAKDAVGNISPSTSVAMTYDTTNPTLSLSTSLGLLYKGGDVVALSFGASDTNGLSNFKLEYAADGATYTTPINLATNATTYNWTVPASNTTTAKIRLVATDNATTANVTTVYSDAFTVDSTAPSAPTLTRTSNQYSSSTTVTMTVGSCTDTSHILISETNSQPSVSDSGWQLCSTTASSFSKTVSGEGVHTIYAWAKDAAGNIANSANSIQMTLDTTAPVIAVTTPSAMQGNVSTGSVSWTLTETNVAASTNFTVEVYNGAVWINVGTKAATTGVNTAQSYALLNYSVPNASTAIAKTRVTLTDAAGNVTTAESGTYTIDSAAPVFSSFSINDGATYAGTAIVNIKINIADNFSTGSQISIRLAAANVSTGNCQSEYANNSWSTWTNSTTNIAYNIVPTDGTKKICGWAKDALGNITVMSTSSGTSGVDSSSIEYSTGNPPAVATFLVVKTSTSGYMASSGDALTISWSATDAEGLANNPVSISYTTDNLTWKDITTNLSIVNNGNKTWVGGLSGNPTTGSGIITSFLAPSSNYFKFKIQAKDVAGNTSSFVTSQPFNTGSWNIYAGNKDRGDGGTGKAAVLSGEGFTSLFAINPTNGDIYASDNKQGIRKLDAKTGLVSTVIVGGTSNLPVNGALPATPMMPVGNYNNLNFDSKGRLYIGVQGVGGVAIVIYQIDFANSWVRQYAGGGTADDEGVASTTLQVGSVGSFDEQDSLYVWIYCGGSVVDSTTGQTVGKRIIKIIQNSDGTPGTTSRIIGNCTLANPASGNTAYSQPSSSTPFPGLSTIIPWDNGNKIVVIPYGNWARYKIINGTVYSSNISAPVGPTGLGIYNPNDGLIYRTNGSSVEKVSINISGANGDTATTVFSYSSSTAGCTADGTTTANYCGLINTQLQLRSGILYFADGAGINAASEYAIRYFDETNQLRTLFGGQPFFGDGLNKSLARGIFSGIYYKKSTEPNQAAFPEGLYFMEKSGVVFGWINPSDGVVGHLWGNQARIISTPATGVTITKNLNMGNPYAPGNGLPLIFDSAGLPWMRINNDAVSLDANKKIVRRTLQTTSALLQTAANNANPANYGLYVWGGYQNFATKGSDGLFVIPNFVSTGYDPIISIRYMDFANSITPIIIGGNYLASSNTAASADISTPGGVATAPLLSTCRNGAIACFLNYQSSSDRLYIAESGKMRFITTPDNTATSTLGTLFTLASGWITNFQFTPDGSQLWYFKGTGGLYCYDLSSGKSWCDNSTDHFTIRSTAGFAVTTGANQMTFKDNQTLFVSTYAGEILQFNLPTTP